MKHKEQILISNLDGKIIKSNKPEFKHLFSYWYIKRDEK